MSLDTPARTHYLARLAHFQEHAALLRRRSTWIGNVRLAVALLGVLVLWRVFGTLTLSAGWLLPPLLLFAVLVVWHDRATRLLRRAQRGIAYYEHGLARLEDRWQELGDNGERFASDQHPYASDLDLFGRGSLFQLLNTTRTPLGANCLASWLQAPASIETAQARQQAVQELQGNVALRESLALLLDDVRARLQPAALRQWATGPAASFPSWVGSAALLAGLALFATAVLYWAGAVDRLVLLLAVAVAAVVGLSQQQRVRGVLAALQEASGGLGLLAQVLALVEAVPCQAPLLRDLQGRLQSGEATPSQQLQQLQKRVGILDWRRNQLFLPLSWLLLWGTQWSARIEAWRTTHGSQMPRWIDAVAEMEALLALAAYAYENPEYCWPELRNEPAVHAVALSHALLPRERAVANSVDLTSQQPLWVVSGSNMSGKSTLLRAVGTATVMALTGAPVRAQRFAVGPVTLACSMRVSDSVQEGISRFYAEILRLRQVVELSRTRPPVLFLLDEILSGTNSHDRRIGAEAILQGLVKSGALGFVTTHDLALTRIAETLPGRARNVHFEDQMEDGKMQFDYALREGIVTRSNALELMRSVGLEV